jgi:putative inorganic carbon (hco3(-)) transporter
VGRFDNKDRWSNLPAWLFSAALALTVFSGNWRGLGLPGLVSPDRLLLIAGFAALLVRDPRLGQRPYLRLTPTHVVLLVAAAFAICSAVAAGTIWQQATIFPLVDRFGLVPFLLFLVGPIAFAEESQRLILLGTFLAIGTYLGVIALLQGLGLNSLVFPRYIVDLSTEVQAGRARGPFLDDALNGVSVFFCAIVAAIAYLSFPQAWMRRVAAAVAVLCLFDLLFTQERSVWVGAIAATLCAAAAAPALRRRLALALPLAGLALVAAFVLVPGLYRQTTERIGDQRTEWDRLNLDKAAENMIVARPLFGFGLGTFKERNDPYFEQSPDFPLTNTTGELHNLFLSIGAELGLIGGSIWLLGLALAVGGAVLVRGPPELYPWRIGLIAIAVMWLIVANLVPMVQAFPNQALWLWAGVVWPWRYAMVTAPAGEPAQAAPAT